MPQLTTAPNLVTITMGGNDLLGRYGDDTTAAATVSRSQIVGDGTRP
ncbi:MAG: hypothetical protein HKP61_21615 [Dactylosporangium sp.]|nr:hypothetical protein [Dactylosporangium sp.]NNJ63481.1 hypothetical protein [Dactylosporangium sp.]